MATAVYKGRRNFVIRREAGLAWIEEATRSQVPTRQRAVSVDDPDLILDPTDEDLDLAEAFERGEINAFEYPDGHTFPPGREIESARRSKHVRRFLRH